ncbi:MAG: hypothetical protein PHY05_09830 [Methanothrix sp.]|nr:hypothetical protein [Methanothrix sp.]
MPGKDSAVSKTPEDGHSHLRARLPEPTRARPHGAREFFSNVPQGTIARRQAIALWHQLGSAVPAPSPNYANAVKMNEMQPQLTA